jgi:very-short-patch-repair endonuclease
MSGPVGRTNPHARTLRRDSTKAEMMLWGRLRNRQLAGLKFRRQATVGPYIVDFLCKEIGLVVEADGGQHNEDVDRPRTDFLEGGGLAVLRFWNNDILANLNGVLTMILAASEKAKPSPNPLPLAGEGN